MPEAAERELAALEFAVSHDLRAPLRAIDGFASILAREFASSLPPDGVECVELLSTSAKQLSSMVDALLLLSRLGRRKLAFERVETAEIARRAAADVLLDENGAHAEVAVAELPACEADPELLEQLFTCLLANAVKFSRPQGAARIEIGCNAEDGWLALSVSDNGVGFNMSQADRLFIPFQRLHPASEFEGLGVGLAVARRIVHLHGGRIWAEAAEGEGATFGFTIPSA